MIAAIRKGDNKVLRILDLFLSKPHRQRTTNDVIAMTGYNRVTTLRHLGDLCTYEYLEQNEPRGPYRLHRSRIMPILENKRNLKEIIDEN